MKCAGVGMKRSHRLQKGVASIEFALGFIVLWFMTVMIMDIGLRNYTVAVVNFAASEATRDVKVRHFETESEFEKYFEKVLSENAFSLWGALNHDSELTVDMKQYPNIDALVGERQLMNQSIASAPIASYLITFNYKPLITLGDYTSFPIKREVIAVQEYGRRES